MTHTQYDFEEKTPLTSRGKKGSKIIGIALVVLVIVMVSLILVAGIITAVVLTLDTCTDCEPLTVTNGAVASDHEVCSSVGRKILQDGGNAVDAAIATSFCLGTMNPHSSGIGGGCILMIYKNSNSTNSADPKPNIEIIDSREVAPLNAHQDMFKDNPSAAQRGGLAIAVPGEVKGLYTAWQRHGSLPWNQLVQPAIELAKSHKVYEHFAATLKRYEEDILNNPEMAKIYAPNGKLVEAGDEIKMPELARTLELIAEKGEEVFYRGEIAEKLVKDIQDAGGIINITDFHLFEPRILQPTKSYYQGYEVYGAPPHYGGSVLAMALNILERYNLPTLGYEESLHYIIEAIKFAFAYRTKLGDPNYEDISEILQLMHDKGHSATLRQKIHKDKTFEPKHYAPPSGFGEVLVDSGTTHISVVDKNRNAVAVTTTINLIFGSFVQSPSTGILLNDEMDDFSIPNRTNADGIPPSKENFIKPFKKPLSSMTPTMVFKDGKLHLIIGASGGPKIITSVLQVLLNIISFNENVGRALKRPRFHHQLSPNELVLEYEFSSKLEKRLNKLGHASSRLDGVGDRYNIGYNAVVQTIQILENGELQAASDWRKGGKADGY